MAPEHPMLSPQLRGASELLGVLLLEGDRIGARDVRDVPGLDELFVPFSDEEVAAAHHACFHEQVFPYASVFLTVEAQCGGAVGQWADDCWARLLDEEHRPSPEMTADHLGLQLLLLARLPDPQATSLVAGFMMPWLPVLRSAFSSQPGPWRQVIELTIDVVHASATALHASVPELILPEPPALFEDDKTGLKDIARFLLTPAWTGVFLSRADLMLLGRQSKTPIGFGSRLHLLENLLVSAAEYGDVTMVLQSLAACIHRRAEAMPDEPCAASWRARAVATVRMLEEMQDQIGRLSQDVAGAQ